MDLLTILGVGSGDGVRRHPRGRDSGSNRFQLSRILPNASSAPAGAEKAPLLRERWYAATNSSSRPNRAAGLRGPRELRLALGHCLMPGTPSHHGSGSAAPDRRRGTRRTHGSRRSLRWFPGMLINSLFDGRDVSRRRTIFAYERVVRAGFEPRSLRSLLAASPLAIEVLALLAPRTARSVPCFKSAASILATRLRSRVARLS